MSDDDDALGIGEPIIRRDFIGATLAGAGAMLLGAPEPARAQGLAADWTGYAGTGDYARSNGNTAEVVNAAHALRDGRYEPRIANAPEVDEPYDLVIVGGGFAAMIAAYDFKKQRPNGRCLVLDNHRIFGGEAKQNQMIVDGVTLTGPQGSNDAVVPTAENSYAHVAQLWDEIGMPRHYEFERARAVAPALRFARDHYDPMFWDEGSADVGYFFDGVRFGTRRAWVRNPWSDDLRRAPLPEAVRRNLLAWKRSPVVFQGDEGRINRRLDSMTYGEFVLREMKLSKDVFRFADPLLAVGDFAASSDAISAYAAKLLGLPGVAKNEIGTADIFSFPGGNAAILRHIVKAMIPDAIPGSTFHDILFGPIAFDALDRPQALRVRLGATAIAVAHDGPPERAGHVLVTYARDGKLERVRAKAAIVATGGWIAKHIVRDLPPDFADAFAQFHHGPILVANVAVRNWRPFAKLGITAARWFDGFGFFVNVRQPMVVDGASMPLDPEKPAMLTFYVGFPQAGVPLAEQVSGARGRLFGTSYAAFEVQIRRQLQTLFGGAGFDARRDIAGIVLNRWGHAFISPAPGFYFERHGKASPLDVVRRGYGRIAFGHSELSGRQSWGRAATEGRRALAQVIAAT